MQLNYYQPPPFFSPTLPPGPPSAYPPAGYSGNHPYYNLNWGQAEDQALLHHAQQITMSEGPFTTEVALPTNNRGYRCLWLTGGTLCADVFADFDKLMLHMSSAHDVRGSANRILVCHWSSERGYCGQKYRRDGLRRHIGVHVDISVPCTECGKPFSRNDSMRAHLKRQHGKK